VYIVRCEDNERATTVDFDAKLQEKSAGSESGFKVDIDELHGSADEPQLDVVSASTYQLRTSQKPPLMKKAKSHQQNVRPALGESARNYTSSSSFFMSNDNVPEVPRSAEMVRRKLRLPWKKKKQYLPGEEVSRWRSNFESWRSASQLSLESDTATERGLWRSESQSELENADSVSVGWTDSDTDAMSDDPLGESFNERGTCSVACHIVYCSCGVCHLYQCPLSMQIYRDCCKSFICILHFADYTSVKALLWVQYYCCYF